MPTVPTRPAWRAAPTVRSGLPTCRIPLIARRALVGVLAGLALACGGRLPAFGQAVAASPRLTSEHAEGGIWILDRGERVCFYQRDARSLDGKYRRAHYLHPLYGLDGSVLTEDFPADHLHHRGIFWAWHQVLVGDTAAGDAWATRDFEWDVRQAEVSFPDGDTAVLRAVVHWKSPRVRDAEGEPAALVEETCLIRVHAAQQDRRALDFEIRLRALREEIRLGGSDNVKGYGGFSTRVRLSPETVFRGADGPVEPQVTAVAASPWMNIEHAEYGLAILAHPSLPDYPPRWILRQQRSMQNPVFPGRRTVALPVDQPLVLRYGLVIQRRPAARDSVRTWHADYVARGAIDEPASGAGQSSSAP